MLLPCPNGLSSLNSSQLRAFARSRSSRSSRVISDSSRAPRRVLSLLRCLSIIPGVNPASLLHRHVGRMCDGRNPDLIRSALRAEPPRPPSRTSSEATHQFRGNRRRLSTGRLTPIEDAPRRRYALKPGTTRGPASACRPRPGAFTPPAALGPPVAPPRARPAPRSSPAPAPGASRYPATSRRRLR